MSFPPIHFSFCWCYPTKKSVTEESVTTTHPPVLFAFLVLWSCDENHSYLYSNLYLLQGKYYLLIILFFCRKGELLLTGSVWTIGTCILFSLNCIKKNYFFPKFGQKLLLVIIFIYVEYNNVNVNRCLTGSGGLGNVRIIIIILLISKYNFISYEGL